MRPGLILTDLWLAGIGVPAGQKLYGVMPGDKVRVKATIQYRGPAYNDRFYAAIGSHLIVFDELWDSGMVPVSFAQSANWMSYELTADILITPVAKLPWTPGWFDLYAKLSDFGLTGLFTPRQDNVIEVILAAEFQNFSIASYDKIAGA